MQNEDIRSHRPVDLRRSRWVLGDVTEVLDHSSWRPGKIAEVLKNDYFVIRLTGCIQPKEFHISCLRVPSAYHSKQLTIPERVSELPNKQIGPTDCSSHYSKFVMRQKCQMYEDDHSSKRKARRGPKSLVKITSKKQKAAAYKVLQPTKKVLPLKVSARTNIDASHFYRPLSKKCNGLAKNNIPEGKRDREVIPSFDIPLHVREENECSVASCSANCLEYCTSDDQQSVRIGGGFPDDVMSTCLPLSGEENKNVYGLHMNVHELELQAYQSTVRAFHAAGPLTWEQESLLTNLRLSLNISNEEHLLQLRHLLSS